MSIPTLSELSIRLTAVDGIGAVVPSSASVPTIKSDLNGLHDTINQLSLVLQAELNKFGGQITQLQTAIAGIIGEQAIRTSLITLAAATLGGPYTINFPTSYSDGLYTTEVTVVTSEALTSASCIVAGVEQQTTPGHGIQVWIMNNDSITHHVVINVFVRHD